MAAVSVAACLGLSAAEDAPIKPWKDSAELSLVSTNGNSRSATLAFKNILNYDWKIAGLEIEGGGLRSDNESKTTAEQYFAGGKASYKFSERNYLFQKSRWDRNRFAGIDHRYDFSLGAGRELLDLPKDKLFAELGAGYINEERIRSPRNDFASGRAYARYTRALSPTAHFTQDLEYLANFKEEADSRVNTESAVTASISSRFSIKASFIWKRLNRPPEGFVKDDTYTSVALIVNY